LSFDGGINDTVFVLGLKLLRVMLADCTKWDCWSKLTVMAEGMPVGADFGAANVNTVLDDVAPVGFETTGNDEGWTVVDARDPDGDADPPVLVVVGA
jgi:hypothetical protein